MVAFKAWTIQPPDLPQEDIDKYNSLLDDPERGKDQSAESLKIQIFRQLLNSLDINVLDHGFSLSIQLMQQQPAMYNIHDVFNATEASFYQLYQSNLSSTYLTLQNCTLDAVKVDVENHY